VLVNDLLPELRADLASRQAFDPELVALLRRLRRTRGPRRWRFCEAKRAVDS
jgi:hypothetical protein